ncbi:hypothetical protein LV84_03289 [Algoriphagus ratkowskyi]|uniref:Uncharacterized protein n=1 Tax=Algoriphagus ratkowskyi TaxID=57028 RepID=A0A2W7RQJ5_9BACT|nr:hypothetical protein [Algoriphagus ratkowskyi]PZX53085.1 hypothetical protein LV84_03289 [Algoriphagus ratkowskyi]TXD76365.1 hypothetical protein ESW18_16595 [Algoriphagus ratkowskyi]
MKIKNKTLTYGFIAAGLMNIGGVLTFSRFFTNSSISEFDPVVMSNFGLLMILVWGLAYIAIAKDFEKVRWLVAVFAIEKLIYGIVWAKWLLNNDLSEVYAQDAMAGIFYTIYGANDWIFFLFFSYVFLRTMSKRNEFYN